MRLLLVISSLEAGGAERVMSILASSWDGQGHQVSVVTDSAATSDHYELAPNVQRISLNALSVTADLPDKIARNIYRLRRMRFAYLEVAPDLVVAFGSTINVRAVLSGIGLGIPILVSERVDPRMVALPWPWRVLRRLLYPLAACVVAQTEAAAEWIRSFVPSHRVRVIPNPVCSLVRAASRPEALGTRRTIIAVGRLDRQKGFDLLLGAYSLALLKSAEWQLVILGEGREREALQLQIEELGLTDSVLMPGVVKHPEQWLQHAAIFVLSSRFEGFPNALLEAMQCGLPVVAFDCPSGPGEIVRHEQTGLLVPAGEADALAAAIARLATDPNLRQRLGSAAAADVASRFSLQHVCAMWEELLVSVAGRTQ